ncbi:transferrin-binding protein-like solute binding protein [Nitratireductor pacificus]|uniref:Transferrin-binding protein B C-lobe/N-lobe beta-barrel domain-containing protein n=1 Tax=Nitratireductor pacificus pht-3B TaxID=391937 RepID=K2N4Q4_9HYPH|nr:transferrin-binding protein-like solute binding protein [Nitratireductor pacificus]EKF19153.1 hypothetical protein NA2_08486 [Nitratireductor pacificus pht-3B]
MKYKAIALPALMAATALAGCKSGDPEPPMAPYANVYKATYATEATDTMAQLFSAAGKKLEGGTAPFVSTYDDVANKDKSEAGDPTPVKVEKTANGYSFEVAGEKVSFTDADLQGNGDYYETSALNSNNQMRTMASVAALNGKTKEALESGTSSMVPLNYYMRYKPGADAATADDSGGVAGYAIVGLETKPTALPSTGKATYQGRGRIEARAKSYDYDTDTWRVRYIGDATMEADFGAKTVSGSIAVDEHRAQVGGNNTTTDVSGQGAVVMFKPGQIVQNGFTSELEGNAALNTMIQNDGLGQVEAEAYGRFYGKDGGQIGAVIAGESATHDISGVVFGDRQ